MNVNVEQYRQTLGDELRVARKRHGWTREQLRRRLDATGVTVTLQTLATYELGTRHCSVVRLAQLCVVLGETPDRLLARVRRRLSARSGCLRVDLAAVAETTPPKLEPFRVWAQHRLRDLADDTAAEVQLSRPALTLLAQLCDVDVRSLARYLRNLTA